MAKDKKVISLDERRSRSAHRHGSGPHAGRTGAPKGAGETEPAAAPGATGAEGADARPLPGRLIWLYCPTCGTVEYTELEMAGARVHNVCGTPVQEAPVDLDLRAEASIAQINLERLNILQSLLDGQRRRYEEYLHRLGLAAGRSVEPYPVSEDSVGRLPVADVDAFGLLVSHFFHNPQAHFPDLAAPDAGTSEPPGEPED